MLTVRSLQNGGALVFAAVAAPNSAALAINANGDVSVGSVALAGPGDREIQVAWGGEERRGETSHMFASRRAIH